MSVIRGTTPDFVLQLPDYSLTDKTVYVTLEQPGNELTLTGDQLSVVVDGEGSTIAFSMTQEMTLGFDAGSMEVQVKAIDANGHVDATEIGRVMLSKALLEEAIRYAEN